MTDGRHIEILEPGEHSLAELAAAANREHDLAEVAALSAVEHWANAGEALRRAKEQIAPSEWIQWLDDNFKGSQSWGQFCVRLATYRSDVEVAGITSVRQAKVFLRGLPAIERGVEFSERRAQAEELRDAGYTYRAIAASLDCSLSTVQKWCNPRTRERIKQRKREWARAKSKMLADRAAREVKGAQAEAYAMAERFQDVIGQAHRESSDPEARRRWARAGEHYRKMRDEIVGALGAES